MLPEGNEPRTVKAAAICAERGIATCVLLNPDEITRVAASQGVELGAGIEIVDPKWFAKATLLAWSNCVRQGDDRSGCPRAAGRQRGSRHPDAGAGRS